MQEAPLLLAKKKKMDERGDGRGRERPTKRRRRRRRRVTKPSTTASSFSRDNDDEEQTKNTATLLLPRKSHRHGRSLVDLVKDDDDDADYCLDLSKNNYPERDDAAERAVRNALPSLLYQRQYESKLSQAPVQSWQRRALVKTRTRSVSDKEEEQQQQGAAVSWRPYATRRISFLDLGTPYTEALLALDPTGSFMLTMADQPSDAAAVDANNNRRRRHDVAANAAPTVFLCVRGVPSPAGLRTTLGTTSNDLHEQNHPHRHHQQRPISPRLLTIPFYFAAQQGTVKGILGKRKIVLSLLQDWRLGLCLCHATNRPKHAAAHVTVFPLARALRSSSRDDDGDDDDDNNNNNTRMMTIRCFKTADLVSFAEVAGSMDGYNLLFEVDFVPDRSNNKALSFLRQCGCLCVLRIHADLRLTWFVEQDAAISFPLDKETHRDKMGDKETPAASSTSFFSVGGQSFWRSAYSSRLDGVLLEAPPTAIPNNVAPSRVEIAHECVLHLDLLVEDILQRRPKVAKRYEKTGSQQQNHHRVQWKSEVIDVVHGGRVVNILLALSSGKAKHPVAVVVAVDLVTQSYRELNWMQTNTGFAHIDMRTLCANFRMKVLRCGPFASPSERTDRDGVFDTDECTPGLHYTNHKQEYCFMPLSALYTDTQVVSNLNILCKFSVPTLYHLR